MGKTLAVMAMVLGFGVTGCRMDKPADAAKETRREIAETPRTPESAPAEKLRAPGEVKGEVKLDPAEEKKVVASGGPGAQLGEAPAEVRGETSVITEETTEVAAKRQQAREAIASGRR